MKLNEIKRMQQLAGLLKENQLNEVTNEQIVQFVQAVDPDGERNIRVYFNNPGSYTIDGAVDYLASHSSLYNDNPNSEDKDGGLSGFTQNDLIQYAQEAGWDEESIDYMLGLSPVKFLEKGQLNEAKLFADFSVKSNDNNIESRFARSISEIAREYDYMGKIDIPEYFDEYQDGDDFYAGPTESLKFFQTLPDEFIVTNNIDDVDESFKIIKTGPNSFKVG